MLKKWSFWLTFLVIYIALVAGIGAFVEVSTYFAGDYLKELLGANRWVLYYVLPLFIAFTVTALTNKKE
jgi:hypothetical protein